MLPVPAYLPADYAHARWLLNACLLADYMTTKIGKMGRRRGKCKCTSFTLPQHTTLHSFSVFSTLRGLTACQPACLLITSQAWTLWQWSLSILSLSPSPSFLVIDCPPALLANLGQQLQLSSLSLPLLLSCQHCLPLSGRLICRLFAPLFSSAGANVILHVFLLLLFSIHWTSTVVHHSSISFSFQLSRLLLCYCCCRRRFLLT